MVHAHNTCINVTVSLLEQMHTAYNWDGFPIGLECNVVKTKASKLSCIMSCDDAIAVK